MNLRSRKILSLFLSLALVIGIMVGTAPGVTFAEEEAMTLTILHTNDVHGRFEYKDAEDRDPAVGYAKYKTIADGLREEGNVLILDAGDVSHGTLDSNLSEGKAMIDLMNLLEADALVPGNHDFNFGYERLLELKELASFPVIAANVVHEADGSTDFDAYTIKEYDGFKVGIFGIATEETKVKSHPDNTVGIEFTDYIEAAEKAVKDLQAEEVDIIIALTHIGVDGESDVTAVDIAEAVEGIDIIVDGHSHTTLEEGKLVGETLIVQTGSYLSNIGKVELKLEDGKIVEKKASLITVEEVADVEEDEEVGDYIEELLAINEIIKKEVIGSSKVELVGEREVVRKGESTLGNLITDSMLHAMGDADVAFTNGGGIRASIAAGDITLGDALTAFPFTNILSTIEVTGEEIILALEHGVQSYPETAGGFPHVAGMKYEFDQSKPAGERVTKVMVGEEELDLEKTYVLVTNDFMATGGDGYEMFAGKTITGEGGLFSDALIAYFKDFGEVEPKMEGRIVVVGEAVEVPEEEPEAPEVPETPEVPEVPEVPEAPEVTPEPRKYSVVSGDVLWRIARKYDTTWEKLAEYNNLKNPHLIFPNQIILIP